MEPNQIANVVPSFYTKDKTKSLRVSILSTVLNSNQGDENIPARTSMTREVVILLYTAQIYLPGLFQRKAFLLVSLLLPFVDFTTDWMNAGNGLQYEFIRLL